MWSRTTHKIKEGLLKAIFILTDTPKGPSILDVDWDTLIVLDDCRFDVFSEEFTMRALPGTLKSIHSLGSWTGEFLLRNFSGEKYLDTVYVSANPFTDRYLKGKVYRLISVWKTGWDERHDTVPPRQVYEAAVRALRKYPDKRIIVHFLQPHHPYLSLRAKDGTMRVIRDSIAGGSLRMDSVQNEPVNRLYLSPIYGQFNIKRLMDAYRENLRAVIPYVELLLHRLRGTSVVTSDHGELFGERVVPFLPIEVYGHGIGRNENLIKVPWWVITDEDRFNLRPVKDILKEIAIIERRFGLKKAGKDVKLKRAISRLKIRGRF